jgi:hypothetical protein
MFAMERSILSVMEQMKRIVSILKGMNVKKMDIGVKMICAFRKNFCAMAFSISNV